MLGFHLHASKKGGHLTAYFCFYGENDSPSLISRRMGGCKLVKIILKIIAGLNSGAFYLRHYLLCLLMT